MHQRHAKPVLSMPLLANLGPKDSLGELPRTDLAATVKGVPEV